MVENLPSVCKDLGPASRWNNRTMFDESLKKAENQTEPNQKQITQPQSMPLRHDEYISLIFICMYKTKCILESTKHCNGKWVCVLSDFLLEMEHLRLSLVHPKHKCKHSKACSIAHFQFIDLCRKIIGLQKSKQWKYMQKATYNSRRLYKNAKRNKLLFFLLVSFFSKNFPELHF